MDAAFRGVTESPWLFRHPRFRPPRWEMDGLLSENTLSPKGAP